MKIYLILLLGIISISCSTKTVLKTDSQKNIDLSGRWNDTDAEIATNQLFNNLITSTWFKDYKSNTNPSVRISVQEFESNFDHSGLAMQDYFSEYIKASQLVSLIEDDSSLQADFQLGGSINADEFINEEQNYIDYILTAHLEDLNGKTLWQDNTTVKKYIKD
jgi:PBP1b-binding outer membrane lipoprotein LpoB